MVKCRRGGVWSSLPIQTPSNTSAIMSTTWTVPALEWDAVGGHFVFTADRHFFFSAFPSIRRPPQFNLSPSSASSSPLSNTPPWNHALSEVRRSSSAAPSWGMIPSLFLHPRHHCRRRGNHHHRRCRRLCRNVAVSPSISSTCRSAIAVAAFAVVYVTPRSLPLLLWCRVPPPPLLLPAHHAPLPSLTVSRRRLLSIRTSSGGGIFSSRSDVCARAKTAAASLRQVSLSKTMTMMMVAMQERRG